MITSLDTQFVTLADQTLARLDADEDFTALDIAVNATALCHCQSLDFADDVTIGSQRYLIYTVKTHAYTGGWDRDEDGAYADYEKVSEQITVNVHPAMTVQAIAADLTAQIKAIPGNTFA